MDGKRYPIAYYSRKFTPAEQNYDIYDKELLAIVAAIQHWRIYAESASELTIYTDHKNLLHFTTTKELNRRQVRWSELLGAYKFTIKYTPGKDNGRADALSRRSDYMATKEITEHSILRQNPDGSLSPNKQQIFMATRIIGENLRPRLQEAYEDDELVKKLLEHQGSNTLLTLRGLIFVPDSMRNEIIQRHHDGPENGHLGTAKTVELITRNYTFNGMRKQVDDYIKKCRPCQINKHATHKKHGQI